MRFQSTGVVFVAMPLQPTSQRQHTRTKENVRIKKFSCDKCHARFARKEYLKKHTCGKEFQCEYCERKFKRELDLQMHKEKQTTPCQKEYECYDCGRKFRNTTQMKKHILYYCTENITPI